MVFVFAFNVARLKSLPSCLVRIYTPLQSCSRTLIIGPNLFKYIYIYIYIYIYENSSRIHEENTKENRNRVVSLYVIDTCDFVCEVSFFGLEHINFKIFFAN